MSAIQSAVTPDGARQAQHLLEWELREAATPEIIATTGIVRVFVRLRGRPVGWLLLHPAPSRFTADMLQRELARQLGAAVDRAAVREALSHHGSLSSHDQTRKAAVSVVVCTRDRTTSLRRCLESLLAVAHESYEVIVVDNAPSGTDTAALVAALLATDPRARNVLRHVIEPRPGLDWARNRGLHEARHDIIAYTDDDVEVDRHWVSAIAAAFADPDVQLVTGLILPAALDTAAQVMFEDVYGGMGKGFDTRTLAGATLDMHTMLGAHHLGAGANMSLRRGVLEALGGFDTALDVGTPSHGAGDLDLFHRVLVAGGVARYEPMAIVRHHHRRDMGALQRQLNDNGRAFGVYLLQRWRAAPGQRGAVVRYALGTWLAWMVGRFLNTLRRRERLPLRMQSAEWTGALRAPFAWRETYAHDRALRQRLDASA